MEDKCIVFDLMKEKIDSLNERISGISDSKPIYVWGTGNAGILFLNCIKRKSLNVISYVDSNPTRIGQQIGSYQIISPDSIPHDSLVLICAMKLSTIKSIVHECTARQIEYLTVDEYILGRFADDLYSACKHISDNQSLSILCSIIINRLNLELPENISGYQYYAIKGFKEFDGSGIFIDMGAYDGAELGYYFEHVKNTDCEVICFEPDENNVVLLENNIKKFCTYLPINIKNIHIECAGVGEKTLKMNINSGIGVSTAIVSGGGEENVGQSVKVYSLDDYLNEKQFNKNIEFLKADIEAFEYGMIMGAKNTIIRNHPKMAICIYHTPADLFDIINLIYSIDQNYNFSIRHHSNEWYETVLYCY